MTEKSSSTMSHLPTGAYYIRNNQRDFAGRHESEDKSLNPKGVFCPTDGMEPFHLERLYNGRYIIKARGAPTGVLGGCVKAFLVNEEKKEEWNITKLWNGEYIIEDKEKNAGWIALHEEHEPIKVKRLTPTLSIPPHYPPFQTWFIQPLID